MRTMCPNPHTCFERIFSFFLLPREPLQRALRSLPTGTCRLGIHARSAATISTVGSQHGVEQILQCAKHLLTSQRRDGYVWLASGSEDIRAQLVGSLRREVPVHTLGAGHKLPRDEDLAHWSQPIFTYTPTVMLAAAVDMIALSRCRVLIGTRHSTYSYVAQAISSRKQARIRDNADVAGNDTVPCKLYSFTQPVYHAWRRYRKVSKSARCRNDLRTSDHTWFDAVFDAESELPVMSQ
jgi:hypothetical protein